MHEGRQSRYSDRFAGHSVFVSFENREAEASILFARLLGRELKEHGLRMTGINPENDLVEIIELPTSGEGLTHPWFVGVQFHPEYRTSVQNPHPLFVDFIRASVEHAKDCGSLEEPSPPSAGKRRRRAAAKGLFSNPS